MSAYRTLAAIQITAEQEIKCLLDKGFTREMLAEALASFVPENNDGLVAIAREWTESRYYDDVPDVDWRDDWLGVSDYYSNRRYGHFRARAAV